MVDQIIDNSRNEALTVGATSQILSRRPQGQRRISIVVRNQSAAAQVVTIHQGNQKAVAGSGIVLNVGDVFVDNSISDKILAFQGDYNIIASGAAAEVAIQERIE